MQNDSGVEKAPAPTQNKNTTLQQKISMKNVSYCINNFYSHMNTMYYLKKITNA